MFNNFSSILIAGLVWVSSNFVSIEDAADFLNALETKRATEAKVVYGVQETSEGPKMLYSVIYRADDLTECGDFCD